MLLVSSAVLAVALLWWRAQLHERVAAPVLPAPVVVEPAPQDAALRTARRKWPTIQEAAPTEVIETSGCLPDAAERCLTGDVWLVDSCGQAQEKVEECGELGCTDEGCELATTEPCNEPPEGRCDGDLVRLCSLGRPIAIDCAAKGLRCGIGDEGAECRPEIPIEERCNSDREPTHCEKDVLVRCIDQRVQKVDCAGLRSRCTQLSGASAPSCVFALPEIVQTAGCAPCGCLVNTKQPETCDGRDQDGDGLVDQGLDCGPVPIWAFIITGAGGQTSHAREDIEAEIERANLSFARTPSSTGFSLTLKDVDYVNDPALLELDDSEVQTLASDPRVHPPSDTFYVPVVFTDSVSSGETPKPGLSTLPNGSCGGMQEGRGPEVGMVAVAKSRYETTVAHELGHFFGLCHTHDQQEATPFTAYADSQTGRLRSCFATCQGEGDGICDTPYDPGPELCKSNPACAAACQVSAAPDTSNLMSYYASCRQKFSEQQMALMQHTLGLRRGWNKCLNGSCACLIGGSECPTDMSCRPVLLPTGEPANRCGFDGPRGAAADCQSAADCGQGTVCMTQQTLNLQRCVRPCTNSIPGCTCSAGSANLNVCLEDFGISAR